MRRLFFLGLLFIGIGVVAALGLSVLGHYKVWIFTNSLNGNLFAVGVLYLAVAFFSNASTNEYDRGMTVISSVTKYSVQSHEEVNSKLVNILFFVTIAAIFGALYYFLPQISL